MIPSVSRYSFAKVCGIAPSHVLHAKTWLLALATASSSANIPQVRCRLCFQMQKVTVSVVAAAAVRNKDAARRTVQKRLGNLLLPCAANTNHSLRAKRLAAGDGKSDQSRTPRTAAAQMASIQKSPEGCTSVCLHTRAPQKSHLVPIHGIRFGMATACAVDAPTKRFSCPATTGQRPPRALLRTSKRLAFVALSIFSNT